MDYSTETINVLAQHVSDVFGAALAAQVAAGTAAAPLMADLEKDMRELLRQAGGKALGMVLSASEGTAAAEVPCACGGVLQYQRQRSATLISVFGRISYKRAYYSGCDCGQGRAPLDERYGLEPGAVSSGLAQLLGLAGVTLGFEHSHDFLEPFLLFTVSENTVRSETQTLGGLQAEREAAWCRQSQDLEYLQARLRQQEARPKRLYGSLDAAKVRIEPRWKGGRKPAKSDDWRDVKVVCWYEVEAVPGAQRSARQRKKYEQEQSVFRAKHMRYYCDITDAETFGGLVWGTGCEAQADLASELVFVCDGASWIWKLVAQHYPQAVQIVDWYHAADRVKAVACAAFPTEGEREQWTEEVLDDLWEGRVSAVIRACELLPAGCEAARKAVTYFANHAARMQYHQFRAADYCIGSGTVESGCKQIVAARLQLPGAQWNVAGAVLTAKARTAWLSGDWNVLCAQRAALPLAA